MGGTECGCDNRGHLCNVALKLQRAWREANIRAASSSSSLKDLGDARAARLAFKDHAATGPKVAK